MCWLNILLFFFFFFKQKTAYEMRISDWSSDVCSSDLLRTKHDSEGLVREEKRIKWRIYRPGMVVGHSQTGEMDKIDGPYYFFTLIKKLREMLPPWMPTLGIEGGRINIVPVDFVADAMDHIAHKPKLDGDRKSVV